MQGPNSWGFFANSFWLADNPKKDNTSRGREDEKLPIHSGQMAGVIVIHLMLKLIVCIPGCVFFTEGALPNSIYPKAPWDVMGCQAATCFKALFGVSLGGSGVSIGGVRSLRVESRWWFHVLIRSPQSLGK